jgi:hypothetical protein
VISNITWINACQYFFKKILPSSSTLQSWTARQEHFDFETLHPELDFDPSLSYACGAGCGTRRQSIFTFSRKLR